MKYYGISDKGIVRKENHQTAPEAVREVIVGYVPGLAFALGNSINAPYGF